jgi:predicted glycosyltransferase
MKILIDIGHPAHVHYFKNFTKIMSDQGHRILVTSRNKEIEHHLLKQYKIAFKSRGKGKNTLIGKAIYYFIAISVIYRHAKIFCPDLFISFGSPYAAITSKLFSKPHIVFNDTEHAKLSHLLTDSFSNIILTPSCYKRNLGDKQIQFNGYMELCYLHYNYFIPDPKIYCALDLKKKEKYIIMRFVSWNANHDIGHSGLNFEMKKKIVQTLSKYVRLFISSEGAFSDDFNQYKINIPPEKMHDALAYATLFIGEGATMASECAVLGTAAIYVNSLTAGTLEEQEHYGLINGFRNSRGVLDRALELLKMPNLKKECKIRRQKMLINKIDVTAFMVWFVENYPRSIIIMRNDPDYQYRFRTYDHID